jgi:acyl-CoA thioester hydrolase
MTAETTQIDPIVPLKSKVPAEMATFCLPHTVHADEIDQLGHVNNKVYLNWVEMLAWQHSVSVGITLEKQAEVGKLMLVHQHVLTYHHSCFEGDVLQLCTWIGEQVGCCQRKRYYEFVRLSDQKTVFTGETTWICVDNQSHRPTRIPSLYLEAYKKS